MIRVVFFGTPAPAVPSLRAFVAAADMDVVAVVTNPDRPSGRGHKLTAPPVKQAAVELGLDVRQPDRPGDLRDSLEVWDVDACAVVAYGSILPQAVLDRGGAGFVNLHFSLLPAWRGAAPVPASILAGDTVTGVTCFRLDAGMDTGDVLSTHETRIAADETSGELTTRLAEAGAETLVDAVRGLVDGSLEPVPQDHEQATYASKIAPEDARIDWGQAAVQVDRAVRAFNPMPGAHTTVDGRRLKVHRVRPVFGEATVAPGTVVGEEAGEPVVACGSGLVRLLEVQPAGKPRMTGADFNNGYRPERLGT
ncbi:methionyl-tRNA formyltransferase [Euzebya tangerina]|uniref:methionyl-tRNA formyltransferase n=1 Tax=Euzebya tangerina TaxID=591198 RepID=UPI000E324253|nr:methionyl-tRNA formyltransferase [Euzebya tangerina]